MIRATIYISICRIDIEVALKTARFRLPDVIFQTMAAKVYQPDQELETKVKKG